MIRVDERIKRFFISLGGIILILFIGQMYAYYASFDEVNNKLNLIRPNGKVCLGEVTSIIILPKNPDYIKYNFKNTDSLCFGELYFGNLLDMDEIFKTFNLSKGSKLPVLYNMDRPEYSIPILRKRWLKKHQISIPDSLIKYIPYD